MDRAPREKDYICNTGWALTRALRLPRLNELSCLNERSLTTLSGLNTSRFTDA
jgi:hypothetical protein